MSGSIALESTEVRTLLLLLDSQLKLLRQWSEHGRAFAQALSQGSEVSAPDLDRFLAQRDRLLEAVSLFDRKMTEIATALAPALRTPALAQAVQTRLLEGQTLLAETADQDDKIRAAIGTRLQQLARDASIAQRNRQLLAKFKSQQSPISGEEVDSQL